MSFLRSSGSRSRYDQWSAVLMKRPTGYGDIENLDHYYQDCVIGGPGGSSCQSDKPMISWMQFGPSWFVRSRVFPTLSRRRSSLRRTVSA